MCGATACSCHGRGRCSSPLTSLAARQLWLALGEDEAAQLRLRLGRANTFNPMDPDGYYSLDLAVPDHRKAAELLVALAVAEPGENWLGGQYNAIPGYAAPPMRPAVSHCRRPALRA